MKKIKTLLAISVMSLCSMQAAAKIWRINNNAGVVADFTDFNSAANAATVLAGDTIHLESSATTYATGSSLTKRLVVIGTGYFLDPSNTSTPGNPGLQAVIHGSKLGFLRIGNGANGSKFMGIGLSGFFFNTSASSHNIVIEKCLVESTIFFENASAFDGITIRKCFFFSGSSIGGTGGATITNFVVENCIFYGNSFINLPNNLSGSANIFRNNSHIESPSSAFVLTNCYIANNIFNSTIACTFTDCTIKNNLFAASAATQNLPPSATGNQLGVNMANVYVGGSTGSLDSRTALRPGSPAIGAGLTVGAVVNPDCGAFGATDPYKLSGIPNIPSIYALTVPVSIPSGSNSMNITLSTRNNN